MLLRAATLQGIRDGRITVVFRKWKRPSVKTGGRLRTAIGELAIDAVDAISLADVTAADLRAADYTSRADVMECVAGRTGDLYRIRLHLGGPDPRVGLRIDTAMTDRDVEQLVARLARWDASSRCGPWAMPALELIERKPAVRAPDLAEELGFETRWFKANVRRLKELGLTESLEIGYRLSPRGERFLAAARIRR
jgi:hypothetical protein